MVNRIGVDINQITFGHNIALYSNEDKEQLIAYMRKLNLEVKKVVDKIGNKTDFSKTWLMKGKYSYLK